MAFLCKKCGRSWDDRLAEDNQLLCTRQCGGELTRVVMPDFSRLPSVLALPLRDYYSETHLVMQLHRLCDAAEILTRFLTIVAIGELRARLRDQPLPDELLNELEPIKRPTFGQWRSMLEAVTSKLRSGELLLVHQLPIFVFQELLPGLKGGADAPDENGLIGLRNDLAHGGAMTQMEAQRLLGIWNPWMTKLVSNMSFLDQACVCFIRAGMARRLVGSAVEGEAHELSDEQHHLLQGLNGHVVILRDNRLLDLWPLCDYGRATTTSVQGRREATNESPMIYFRADPDRLKYAALGAEMPFSERADVVKEFQNLFRPSIPVQTEKGRPLDFQQEIQADSAVLIGRGEEIRHVKKIIKNAEKGVFWLSGRAGIGKSFLIARLAADLGNDPKKLCCIVWRFKMGDGVRCNRIAFFRYAVERLAEWLDKQDVSPAQDPDELNVQMSKLLEEVAGFTADDTRSRPRRALFVLDGIDEIERLDPAFVDVPFKFTHRNAVWLCAGRSEGTLPQVFTRDRCTHVFPEDLPPMSESDIRGMLLDKSGSLKYRLLPLDTEAKDENGKLKVENVAVEAVVKRAAGLPLYVHFVIEDILAGHFRFEELEDRLPSGLNEYYNDLLRRLSIGELQALLTPLLVTICWSLAPLDEETLHLFMLRRTVLEDNEQGRTALRSGLHALQSTVRLSRIQDGGHGYEPYHPSFREHIREDQAGIIGNQNSLARKSLCELARSWNTIPSIHPARDYALRFGVRHLIETKRWDDLETILTDLAFLEAKTRAEMVFELVGDFADAVNAIPPDRPKRRLLELLQEALRRDTHFIARHFKVYPQALFQCLWNSCWWYDCPGAAKHYIGRQSPAAASEVTQSAVIGSGQEKLHLLLESWRAAKERQSPGFCWLRSLRPPLVHLGTAQRDVLRGHKGAVWSASYSPDGSRVVSVGDDGLRVWDTEKGDDLLTQQGSRGQFSGASYSPDGRRIVSGSSDNTVRIWDAGSGAELAIFRGHEGSVHCAAFSPDGRRIVSGGETVRVWEADSGMQLAAFPKDEGGGWVTCAAFSPDGLRIVGAFYYGAARVWHAQTGAELAVLFDDTAVHSMSFSPDGRRIVGGTWKAVLVWDADNFEQLAEMQGHWGDVHSVDYSPDGRRIVSCADDATVRIWDAHSFEQLKVFQGHQYRVMSANFSPDGTQIVSTSIDQTVRIWDADSGAQLNVLNGHKRTVDDLRYSANGQRLISSSRDGTTRVWDANTGECLEVTRGRNVVTSGASAPQPGFTAFVSNLETVIVDSERQQAVAWYPENLSLLTVHPSGRMWAGTVVIHVHIFKLEGP